MPPQRITALPESLRPFGACTSVGSPQRTDPDREPHRPDPKTRCRPSSGITSKLSWRRDLNPRPSDYKSDALPAELRQPDHLKRLPEIPEKSAGTLLLRAYHGTVSKVSTASSVEQTSPFQLDTGN